MHYMTTEYTALSAEAKSPEYNEILGMFSTYYNESDKSRVNNLQLAVEAINDSVIYPGEVFSYNDAVGPTNKANGYRRAKIIVKGIEKRGYGGGVCQVSSTLYNAAEMAGLEIVERHPHSKKVLYVEEGRDAATSYGVIDLKFKNIYDCPVRIIGLISDGVITVSVGAMLSN